MAKFAMPLYVTAHFICFMEISMRPLMDFLVRIHYYVVPTLLPCMIEFITAVFSEHYSVISTLEC